jgi:hypothetical protein
MSESRSAELAAPRLPFDPQVTLATMLESQKGVYALLIGSGTSTGVGIPTGWGVVEALVRRLAAASGTDIEDGDPEKWWAANANGQDLGYSTLIEAIAPTAPSRRALLAEFFEPTDEERADGQKVPGAAHRAIAKLVARGAIRVIVTTNFDRLLEQAIEAEGIMPQVVSSEFAVSGMEPLQHAPVTVVKLHGDYSSLDQRNTVAELEAYGPEMAALLERVLDEYGLIVSGWSGEWDKALVAAIEKSSARRYPLYWTVRGRVSDVAKRLTARSGSQLIVNTTAETFFPELLSRTEAVASLAQAPASSAVKLARLRRALPDPVRHLEVRELFLGELESLAAWASDRPAYTDSPLLDIAELEYEAIYQRSEPLLHLFTQGILLDRDEQHTDLWVWVLQRSLNVRLLQSGTYQDWWDNLTHYPAFLLLRVGIMAALSAGREEIIVRLMSEPHWSSLIVHRGLDLPAYEVLHLHTVLDHDINQKLPRWNAREIAYPSSKLVRQQLGPIAEELEGRAGSFRLLNRMEFRLALAHVLPRPENMYVQNPAGGEYLGNWPFRDEEDLTAITKDFLANGDRLPWMRDGDDNDAFVNRIADLDAYLKRIRRT